MTFLNEIMFTIIPMIALIANIFLFFTMMTAKKDGPIRAFMGLLFSFILWAGGALLMRSQVYPGSEFWWTISLTGIFMVPYMYYWLFAAYVEQRGLFMKLCLGVGTAIVVVLNFFNVFMTEVEVVKVDGQIASNFTVKWPAIFPVLLAIVIFICIGRMISKTLRDDDLPVSYMMPLFVGIVFMLVGIALNVIFPTLPTDTLGCAVNAGFIYFAFYKKRFYALSQITSKGSMYVISIILTALIISVLYKALETVMEELISMSNFNMTLSITVMCSAMAIVLFLGLNRLNEGLFIREQVRREDRVHEFSSKVSATLHTDEILLMFSDLIKDEIDVEHLYICMYDNNKQAYTSEINIGSLEQPVMLEKDNPVVKRLETTGKGFLYSDFQKTAAYKSMWEQEKQQFERINATYILPFSGDKQNVGITILSTKGNNKSYSFSEIKFLESVTSVAAIALKNAMLYQEIEQEALKDHLTGLYNRRTLTRDLEKAFEDRISPVTMVMLNLDDFSLYNELYGSEEGDRMLCDFSRMLEKVYGSGNTIARYGGKEFAVLMPHCDSLTARKKTLRLRAMLSEHIDNSQERIKKFLTFSAGICSYPTVAANETQLISYANMAVFQIKQAGKDDIRIFESKSMVQEPENHESEIKELTPTIFALTAAIDAKDHYTFNHSQCVSSYASHLAECAGLEQNLVEIIGQAGLLHDIGKIGIPDAILTKKGRLTPEEYAVMCQHVERSIEMIRHLPSLDYIIPAVLGHHERFDGKGYPRGIAGESIPISARCLSIADSFDAMVSKRAYKNKMPVSEALDEIERNLGTQFDPVLGRLYIDKVKDGTIEVIEY